MPDPEYLYVDVSKLLHCGVYALMQKGVVVYVGKSKKPLVRLGFHANNRGREVDNGYLDNGRRIGRGMPNHNGRGINFDGIRFYPCMLGQIDTIEMALIKKFLPKYNKRGMPPIPIPEDIREIMKQMGWIKTLPPQDDRPKVYIRRLL